MIRSSINDCMIMFRFATPPAIAPGWSLTDRPVLNFQLPHREVLRVAGRRGTPMHGRRSDQTIRLRERHPRRRMIASPIAEQTTPINVAQCANRTGRSRSGRLLPCAISENPSTDRPRPPDSGATRAARRLRVAVAIRAEGRAMAPTRSAPFMIEGAR
jgi:hypothetical protein